MTTIQKRNVPAWFSSGCYGPDDLADPGRAINTMSLCDCTVWGGDNDHPPSGWTRIGTAHITVELVDQRELVANKVDALRRKIAQTRADAELKATQIEVQIQQLLAITNEPSEVAA